MKRTALSALIALSALFFPVRAGDLEDTLESRWRGAWALTSVDLYSDCGGFHTNNEVSGTLVRSRGRFGFRPGELAQVRDVDLKRSRIVLTLSLPEPLLLPYQDGPFTLYNEVRCLADLDVELPRSAVKGEDARGIDAAIQAVLARFTTREEATRSRSWNRRQRDPYPEDYDRTLARHAAWKAQTANAAVQARIDQASEETSRIADRLTGDPEYLKGFALGIEAVRSIDLSRCGDLLARDFNNIVPKPPQAAASLGQDAAARYQRGYQDGARLLFGLESMRRLPACMVPVPEVPPAPQDPPPSLPR